MIAELTKHTVIVPILGDDISDDTYAKASALLTHPDSRLVLLHISRGEDEQAGGSRAPATTAEPRWHRLACAISPDRTFIEAVAGDPTTEIRDEADRFHCDTILF